MNREPIIWSQVLGVKNQEPSHLWEPVAGNVNLA